MKLIQAKDTINSAISSLNVQDGGILISMFNTVIFGNANRELRSVFEDTEVLKGFTKSYIISNLQKFKYIIESSTKEFLSDETVSESSGTSSNTAQDYNTNFMGGSGMTDKATDTATTTGNQSTKNTNNRAKAGQFFSATTNSLFNSYLHTITENYIFYEEGDIKW